MNTIQMYDAQADSINVEDIAKNDINRLVLMRIKRNTMEKYNDILYIQNHVDLDEDEDGEEMDELCVDYVPEGANDMGWLGYFVGKNNRLKELYFRDFDNMSIDTIKPFIMGLNNNKSITCLDFRIDLLDGKMFTMLCPFFENTQTLGHITIGGCNLGDDGWRLLALAIGSSKHKTLESVVISQNNISDEALVDIITSLSMHPQLQGINLSENRLSKNGCNALATLLQNSVTQLQNLDLGNNELDDESIYALLPALKGCHQLHTLRLSRNESITSRGWKQFASILEPPTSKLIKVHLLGNNIDDDALAVFASSLMNNDTLTTLNISNTESITRGREAFLKLLCDTSSVNSTFLSNHTLQYVFRVSNKAQFRRLFELNERNNKKEVSTIKDLFIRGQVTDWNEVEYVPEGAHDMGWLGYFVGKNDQLQHLYIRPFEPTTDVSMSDALEPFLKGVSRNRSIQKLDFCGMQRYNDLPIRLTLNESTVFTLLEPFFMNNHNLKKLRIEICNFGAGVSRALAMALGSCTNSSLTELTLKDITDLEVVDIITSLSMHPNIQKIDIIGNHIEKHGCMALATLLKNSATKLQTLDLSKNDIDDEGIDALVPGLKNCISLKSLDLGNNRSITTRGWKHLATILEAPNSNLTSLSISGNDNVDNGNNHEVVTAFTNALINNHKLESIYIGNSNMSSIDGQFFESSFSKLVCNTSSVNATSKSNHTLNYVSGLPFMSIVQPLLRLNDNNRYNKKQVAMVKILQHHNDFDMQPFFEWEFKVLPLMLDWFERASTIETPRGFVPINIEPRKLSTIYQFVRGVPAEYVEARLKRELEEIKEELPQLDKRKLLLEERKRSIMDRLGRWQ